MIHQRLIGIFVCVCVLSSLTACTGAQTVTPSEQKPAVIVPTGQKPAVIPPGMKKSAVFAPTEQEPAFDKTFRLEDGMSPVAATLDEVHWLVGNWVGDAFGSKFEEVWNAPSAGSMVGLFKLYDTKGVKFYEILTLVEAGGSLEMRVKHFSEEFVAWEEKSDFISFPLVAIEKDAIHFSGLSFYKIDQNRIDGYIRMRRKTGVSEEKLEYVRRRLD